MKANFTINQLIQKVRDLANENPDYVYQKIEINKFQSAFGLSAQGSCSYVKSNNPGNEDKGCLLGQAILSLQPDLKSELEIPYSISTILSGIGLGGNQYARKWCVAVQQYQDNKRTWEQSVNYADSLEKQEESMAWPI